MADQGTVADGDYVVFKTDDKCKVFQLSNSRNIFFEKAKLKSKDIIGQKYGTVFEVQQGKLMVVQSSDNGASAQPLSATSVAAAAESGKDNRDLVASGENQKLTMEEIMKMKEEGVTGQDIVEKLVEQSETFKTKTEFSQEKYIKKKKKKHMLVFRILHPCSRVLLDTFRHAPSKICYLRADSLSQLLCYSNVMSGCTVAVVESCHGLILGSVMERLGGTGRVVHLYPGNDMNRHVVSQFNFTADQTKTLHEFPLSKLASLEDGTLLPQTDTSDKTTASVRKSETTGENLTGENSNEVKREQDSKNTVDSKDTVPDSKDSPMLVDKDSESDDDDDDDDEKGEENGSGDGSKEHAETKTGRNGKGCKRQRTKNTRNNAAEQEAKRHLKAQRLLQAATILKDKSLDSLIIATKYDPVAILLRLLPYVAPSRPVVVFCQHKELLVECYTKVKENGCGVQLKLSDSWYREYQVLPSRTHPLMSMSGTGGYLLSFIRVTSQQ